MNPSDGSSSCYYSILGIRRGASSSEIRSAYRKLALKWHPDRWVSKPKVTGEAKRRFQQIQEAYSVLSDEGKRSMYDGGLYNLLEEDQEEEEWGNMQGFTDFMQEMLSMMNNVRPGEESFEDLQKMFVEMASDSGSSINGGGDSNRSATGKKGTRERGTSQGNTAKRRVNVSVSVSD